MKDPTDDPLGTLLLIDSLALKAAEYQFLIDFYAEFKVFKNIAFSFLGFVVYDDICGHAVMNLQKIM